MNACKENPFKYLRRKSNNLPFEDSIVRNWYIARAYVEQMLGEIAFAQDSEEFLHVIVPNDMPRMLFLIRQFALSSHFINFREEMGYNAARTLITIISDNPAIKQELEKEEYLCNLPKYCNYIDTSQGIKRTDSYMDIEIHVEKKCPDIPSKNTIVLNQESVDVFFNQYNSTPDEDDIFKVDTRKAVLTSRIYDLGAEIQNLPAIDIHCAKRYALALDIFQHEKLKPMPPNMVDDTKWREMSLCRIKESISNILCSDCFNSRQRSVKLCSIKSNAPIPRTWERYNEALSRSEHARWTVEKLILGYRPLNEEERYYDEFLHAQFNNKAKKKVFRDGLKRNDSDPAHIDLCSYADLRRINPDDMKYDSFLMLAIPMILAKVDGA